MGMMDSELKELSAQIDILYHVAFSWRRDWPPCIVGNKARGGHSEIAIRNERAAGQLAETQADLRRISARLQAFFDDLD